jgi:chromosome partitioning protein
MSIKILAFFNNKGGVGKTSLVYHLAWMYADLGKRVLAADLDPQANLSAAFFDEDRFTDLWSSGPPKTVFDCVRPLVERTGDIALPHIEPVGERLASLVGDLSLSSFEDQLSENWPKCSDGDVGAFRVISALWRVMQEAAKKHEADIILMDLGPNLGAINRAALIASDYVVVPLSPDLFSLQGLRNLGPTLRRWRTQWKDRAGKNPPGGPELPAGKIEPIGYIVLQHVVRLDRPARAYDRWIAQIPSVYSKEVLGESEGQKLPVDKDPNCLALLKHYRSLMPLAQDARKPMFHLKPADGAIGAHFQAAQNAYKDFVGVATEIARRIEVRLP